MRRFLWALAAVLALAWAWRMAQMALYPFPHYEAESSMAWSTHLLLQGMTPWTWTQYPASLNAYGIGYPWLCQPFVWAFGTDLSVLRWVTLGCLVLAAGVVYAVVRRQGPSSLHAAWAALACLWAWGLFYTPIAKPDGLVVLLYLACLSLTEAWPPQVGRAALAGALGAVAFFVKPYGLLGAAWAILALAARGRWREAAVAAVAFGVCGSVLALAIHHGHPLYFEEVLLVNMDVAGHDSSHRWRQWMDLAPLCGAMMALALAALALGPLDELGRRLRSPWALALLASAALFHFKLSLHTGAYLTYFLQLTWPCLVLAGLSLAQERGWDTLALSALVGCTAALALQAHAQAYPALAESRSAEARLQAALAPNSRPAGRGHAAWLLWPRGSVTLDFGQAEFARFGEDDHGWPALFPEAAPLRARRERFEKNMASLVQQRRFGRLLLGAQEHTAIEKAALKAYRVTGQAVLATPQMKVFERLSLFEEPPTITPSIPKDPR